MAWMFTYEWHVTLPRGNGTETHHEGPYVLCSNDKTVRPLPGLHRLTSRFRRLPSLPLTLIPHNITLEICEFPEDSVGIDIA